MLSHRLLIFAPDQVHFVCNFCAESEAISDSRQSRRWNLAGLRQSDYISDLREGSSDTIGDPSWPFNEYLNNYTVRDLSYQSDIHNAFRGILRSVDYYSFLAVPFLETIIDEAMMRQRALSDHLASKAFSTGLAWSTSYNNYNNNYYNRVYTDPNLNLADLIRKQPAYYQRPGFPSWSWHHAEQIKSQSHTKHLAAS